MIILASSLLFNINPLLLVAVVTVLSQEDLRITLLQLRNYFLSVLKLRQRGLEGLDGQQDFSPEMVTAHDLERPLQNVVAKLVVN